MSDAILHVEPGAELSRAAFRDTRPPYSIALDGYVAAKSFINGRYANFNHHSMRGGLDTRATCAQADYALHSGKLRGFYNGEQLHIYVNDPDQDVCMSTWSLMHDNPRSPPRSAKERLRLERLIRDEDRLDTTVGTFPTEPEQLARIAWIFDPYTKARISGKLYGMDGEQMRGIILETHQRIEHHIQGGGNWIEPDMRFADIARGEDWRMIREIGPYARMRLNDGTLRLVVTVCPRENGNHTYTIAKLYGSRSLRELKDTLNQEESAAGGHPDWDGGSHAIGPHRKFGSRIKPQRLGEILDDQNRTANARSA